MQAILSESEYKDLLEKEKELKEIKEALSDAVRVEYVKKNPPNIFEVPKLKKITISKEAIEEILIQSYMYYQKDESFEVIYE